MIDYLPKFHQQDLVHLMKLKLSLHISKPNELSYQIDNILQLLSERKD
jgi:hypothetical protein